MIENLLIKKAIGISLDKLELEEVEKALRQNPSFIKDYINLKKFFKYDFEFKFDSILVFKKEKRVFSTIDLEKKYFNQVRAAGIGDRNCIFITSLKWNDLLIDISSEIYSNKIIIKSLTSENEITFKDGDKELFHIVLASGRDFSYVFKSKNTVLNSKDNSLLISFI
ncbi:MAG: hypothetical protein ACK4YF_00805 [Exilispira sp.]